MSDEKKSGDLVDLKSMKVLTPKEEKTLSNCWIKSYPDGNRMVEVKLGYAAPTIKNMMTQVVNKMPMVFMGKLFVVDDGVVTYLENSNDLFGWISGQNINIDWSTDADCAIKKTEFYSYLIQSCKSYDVIAECPHFPKIKGVFYTKEPQAINSGKLSELLSFLSPATDDDRDFLRAAILTAFWGGRAGTRPAILLDGLDGDKAGGKGIGKTTVTDIISELLDGEIDLSKKTDDGDMRKLILGSRNERLIRFDNIKSDKFSSETVESLITSRYISGHKMYRGFSKLPNYYTYLFTFNNASMSKDMAQRSIVVRLARPKHDSNWEENVYKFIDDNRDAIIADIGWILTQPVTIQKTYSRWSLWEREVLSRASANCKLGEVLLSAQKDVDDEDDLGTQLIELIEDKLSGFYIHGSTDKHYLKPHNSCFAIKKSVLAEWCQEVLGKLPNRLIFKRLRAYCNGHFPNTTYCSHGTRFSLWKGSCAPEIKTAYRIDQPNSCAVDQKNCISISGFS